MSCTNGHLNTYFVKASYRGAKVFVICFYEFSASLGLMKNKIFELGNMLQLPCK